MSQQLKWANSWTDEVRKCYNYGWSCSRTATHMNKVFGHELPYLKTFTRNGIIGKWHRMGLRRGKSAREGNKDHHRDPRTNGFGFNLHPRELKGTGTKKKPGRGLFKDIEVKLGEVATKGFEDLDEFGSIKCCRWPFETPTGRRFCGRDIDTKGRPYCDEHLTRAYQKDLRGVESKT